MRRYTERQFSQFSFAKKFKTSYRIDCACTGRSDSPQERKIEKTEMDMEMHIMLVGEKERERDLSALVPSRFKRDLNDLNPP